jgi:hypothetical protein
LIVVRKKYFANFLRDFDNNMLQSLLSSPKTTGAVAVYSQSSIKDMLQHQDRNNIRTIVEV